MRPTPWSYDALRSAAWPDLDIGWAFLVAGTNAPETVHRRVESLKFINDEMVERRVSVDFRSAKQVALPEGCGWTFPLATIQKGPLREFNLMTDSGQAIPLLNRYQTNYLAWSGLVTFAKAILHELPEHHVRVRLQRIVASRPETAAFLVRMLGEKDGPQGAALAEHPAMRAFLTYFSQSYWLSPHISDAPVERRILKYSYVEEVKALRSGSLRKRVAVGLGLEPSTVSFQAGMAGAAVGYHLEVTVPDELTLVDGVVRSSIGRVLAEADGSGSRIHLFVDSAQDIVGARAQIRMRMSGEGFVLGGTLLTAAIAVSLGAIAGWYERIYSSPKQVDHPADIQSVVALVLLLPGFLASLLARPDEHRLSAAVFASLRWLLIGVATLTFTAGVLIAFRVEPPFRATAFAISAGLAGLASLPFVIIGTRSSRVRRKRG